MKLPREKDYPKVIYLGEEVYRVEFRRRMPKGVLGLCDSSRNLITIQSGLGPLVRFQTFIHEVMHSICFEHGIKMKHSLIHDLDAILSVFFIQNF